VRVGLSAVLLAALLASGCYERHDRSYPASDAGVSPFEGRWLVDQPFHAGYEATVYELAADGRFIERCGGGRPSGGGWVPPGRADPVAIVERASDGMGCELVGPWTNRFDTVLAVEAFCDDSVSRTVVLDFVWEGDQPISVEVQKVDGETEGWSHPGFEWRWLPCATTTACSGCE